MSGWYDLRWHCAFHFDQCAYVAWWQNSFSLILKGCLWMYISFWSTCTGCTNMCCHITGNACISVLWWIQKCDRGKYDDTCLKSSPPVYPRCLGWFRSSQVLENMREICNSWLPIPTESISQCEPCLSQQQYLLEAAAGRDTQSSLFQVFWKAPIN